jgi:hypothetical protein
VSRPGTVICMCTYITRLALPVLQGIGCPCTCNTLDCFPHGCHILGHRLVLLSALSQRCKTKILHILMTENCRPSAGTSGHTIVNHIRNVAHRFGSITVFRAYLDVSEGDSSKSLRLRSELQSSGISLIDCPHNGKKDVVDNIIMGMHL